MKIAIVTGASSGMGREFVRQLHGYCQVDEIWAVARREANLEALKEETPIPVRSVVLDLLQKENFAAFAQLLEAEKPDVKLLVNAAGFGKFGKAENVSLEDDLGMIDLNCLICIPAATFCSWIASLPSSPCLTSPPTAHPRPSSSATAVP